MDNLAEQISPEERLYFGEETLAKHAEELKTYSETVEPQETETAPETPLEKPAEPAPVAEKTVEQRMVPQEALHAAREEAKALKAQYATLENRFNEVLQRIPKSQEPQGTPQKSIEDDPIGAIRQHEAEFQAWRQQQAQQQQFMQLQSVVAQRESEFRAEQPHYDAALQHLTAARTADYRALGLAEPAIAQALQSDAANMAVHALRMGRNPAEMVYGLAVARGFAPPAAQKPAEPEKPAEVPAEKKMEMLEAGAAAAKTLQGGTGGATDLDLKSLAGMSSKEIGNLSDEQWRKLAMKMN